MKIPKKISPDRIKDSIVEIRYSSKLPFEILLGLFFKSLDETYQYTNRPLFGAKEFSEKIIRSTLQLNQQGLFYNDKLKISVLPARIIFNCLENYIGWEVYFNEIKKTMSQISSCKEIDFYTRASVRYISEYPNTDLKECVKFNFTFGMPEVNSKAYTFHSEFNIDNNRIILNLKNKIPLAQPLKNDSDILISIIDIDVINENVKTQDLDQLFLEIEKVHTQEKKVFFTLLNEKFLNSLNPTY